MTKDHIEIWWLDDEIDSLDSFIAVIQEDRRCRVRKIRKVDEGLRLIREGIPPDFLVWDEIMPRGEELTQEETDSGLRTGSAFYRRFRRAFPHVPALLFTNIVETAELQRFHADSDHSSCARKRDLVPDDLFDLIRQKLNIKEAP